MIRRIIIIVFLMYIGTAIAQEEAHVIDGKSLSEWINQLRSDNRGLQLRAAKALAGVPSNAIPQAVKALIPILSSERDNDRFAAAQTLGEYGSAARSAVPHLLPLLVGTQYERNRAAAAKALGQILKDAKSDEEVDKVAQALTRKISDDYDAYSDVRREVVKALGMIGPAAKSCIPKLTRVIFEGSLGLGSNQDQEYRLVRRAAAWTCARIGPLAAQHIDLLITRMHMEGEWCPEVVEAIGAIGAVHDNVIPNIIDKIESSGRGGDFGALKEAAFSALANFGEKSAPVVPLTRRLLQGPMWGNDAMRVRIAMMKALPAFGPAAKDAVAEILAQIRIGKERGTTEHLTLLEEATKAYKTITG